ncbi:MAG: hypothetical protein QXP52_02515 [Candidatus Aenigmatarchaeota archaeon]
MNIFNLCKCKSSFLKIIFIFLAICILGFLIYLSYLAFEESQSVSPKLIEKHLQLIHERDIKDEIEKTFNITPHFAKEYHVIYSDTYFVVSKIIFASENDAYLFIYLLKKYYAENFRSRVSEEFLDVKNDIIIYKIVQPKEYGEERIEKIIQKDETVFILIGYTNKEELIGSVKWWFIRGSPP